MTLLSVVLQVAAVVALMHAIGLVAVVRVDDLGEAVENARRNLGAVASTVGVLAVVITVNATVRSSAVDLSWIIGVNLTGAIHALEGQAVAELQTIATPALTAYFGFIYVFGYVFLLTFPLVAFAIDDEVMPLQTTVVAYAVNYAVGIGCYVVFVAYGPRNFMPELVSSLLYTSWPEAQVLTSTVNVNTNVFPSLHTSLSVTAAIIAYRFRDGYSRWTPIAFLLAVSVALSTMYLGIHWVTDVVAGVVLGGVSVAAAARVPDGGPGSSPRRRGPLRLTRWIRDLR